MDEGDFISGNTLVHEFLFHIVIHGEVAGRERNDGIHVGGHGRIFAAVVIRFHPLGIFRIVNRFSPRI